jgi:hypothetical protein
MTCPPRVGWFKSMLLLAAAALVGCSVASPTASGGSTPGGGAAQSTAGSGGDITTWRDTTLPGHLLAENLDQRAGDQGWLSSVFDLREGTRSQLPASPGLEPSDSWGTNGSHVWRFEEHDSRLTLFTWPGLAQTREVTLPKEVSNVKIDLSPNGRMVLASWHDDAAGESFTHRNLAVFDTATGELIERGSLQPDGYGDAHAWLTDEIYIYLLGKKIYATMPNQSGKTVLFELDGLPDNGLSSTTRSSLAVSPDRKRIALTWAEPRNDDLDTNLWVVNLDGTGLHRLTTAPSPTEPLKFVLGSPTWSPDGKYVAVVRYMSGVTTAPVFPDSDFSGKKVVGTTGCTDEVFVLPVETQDAALTWPTWDVRYGVKVLARSGRGGEWLAGCGGAISWLP